MKKTFTFFGTLLASMTMISCGTDVTKVDTFVEADDPVTDSKYGAMNL